MTKTLLKDVVEPCLPAEVVRRPKRGFAMPLPDWLRGSLDFRLDHAASRPLADVVDLAYVDSVRAEHAEGRDRTAALHGLIFLDHGLERWT